MKNLSEFLAQQIDYGCMKRTDYNKANLIKFMSDYIELDVQINNRMWFCVCVNVMITKVLMDDCHYLCTMLARRSLCFSL